MELLRTLLDFGSRPLRARTAVDKVDLASTGACLLFWTFTSGEDCIPPGNTLTPLFGYCLEPALLPPCCGPCAVNGAGIGCADHTPSMLDVLLLAVHRTLLVFAWTGT